MRKPLSLPLEIWLGLLSGIHLLGLLSGFHLLARSRVRVRGLSPFPRMTRRVRERWLLLRVVRW